MFHRIKMNFSIIFITWMLVGFQNASAFRRHTPIFYLGSSMELLKDFKNVLIYWSGDSQDCRKSDPFIPIRKGLECISNRAENASYCSLLQTHYDECFNYLNDLKCFQSENKSLLKKTGEYLKDLFGYVCKMPMEEVVEFLNPCFKQGYESFKNELQVALNNNLNPPDNKYNAFKMICGNSDKISKFFTHNINKFCQADVTRKLATEFVSNVVVKPCSKLTN